MIPHRHRHFALLHRSPSQTVDVLKQVAPSAVTENLGTSSSGPSHNDVVIIASIISISIALLALMSLLWKRPQYFAALRHDRWCCVCARSHKKRNGRRNSWMSFPEDPFTRVKRSTDGKAEDGRGGHESEIGTEGVERSASTLVFGDVKKEEV
ncbi:hypothetical protein BD410DRAFT_783505 [Rickenella mellea]|uniref:Uncharacterized protein n=1 Tax=Rickenella mellea TaxID=50990 RepID=A0A4Y7QHY5_9AGAM|nr:hypothetical protein BD410DRAFT_783505 [Rickenella mellea]